MWRHPTGTIPEAVSIIALGVSRLDWDATRLSKGVSAPKTEVWTVNRGLRLWQHDLAFVMDDLRRESAEDPTYGESIAAHHTPIITSKKYPENGDHILEMPLAHLTAWAVANKLRPYWCNSIPFMIAYAAFIGAKSIYIQGADYTDDQGRVNEKGRSNVEYWIGACEGLGVQVGVSPNCRLLGHGDFPPGYVYGYDLQWEARAQVMMGINWGREIIEAKKRADADEPALPEGDESAAPAPDAEPTPPSESPPSANPDPVGPQWVDSEGNPTTVEDAPTNELGLSLAYCIECGARWPRHSNTCEHFLGPFAQKTAG